MINFTVSGPVLKIGESKDGKSSFINIKVYEQSAFGFSVLGVPKVVTEHLNIGDDFTCEVSPRSILVNGKPKTIYYYKI